jgi:hypothetical protein
MLNKKTILIGIILVIIVGVVVLLLLFKPTNNLETSSVINKLSSFFPLDDENEAQNNNQNPGLLDKDDDSEKGIYKVNDLVADFDLVNLGVDQYYIVYSDLKNGNIISWDIINKIKSRLTNTTITSPHSLAALNGDDFLRIFAGSNNKTKINYQYFDIPISNLSNESSILLGIKPKNLPSYIEEIETMGKNILTTEKVNSLYYLYLSNINLENKKEVFTSPTSNWSTFVDQSQNKVFLSTKPTKSYPGYLYLKTANNPSLEKILLSNSSNGLSILPSPDGNKILYSLSTNQSLSLNLYDTATKNSTPLPFLTFAEKCVWTEDSLNIYCGAPRHIPFGEYPDDWYKGIISFSDDIVVVGINNSNDFLVVTTLPENFDTNKIKLVEDGRYIVLQNKKDMSLWVSELNY